MRIVSGILRGRHINPPAGFDARPTTDFAKEGLFNVLTNYFDFDTCNALDLFAGSGNITFEMYSRGCNEVTSIEINDKYVSFINKCIFDFKCTNIQVLKADAFRFLNNCSKQYDIIFADPPYKDADYSTLYNTIVQKKLLKPDGMLIFEHPKDIDLSQLDGFLQIRKYAGVQFSFFRFQFTE